MKSHKGYSRSGIILFALSMVYLGAELVFNRQLLDVSSSVQSDPDQVEHIQYFGRAASGLGFTLLVQGVFQQFGFRLYKRKHWTFLAIIALICMLPFITTLGQTFYEKIMGADATGDVPYTTGMWWGLLPFAGFFCVLASKGQKRWAVIIGLVLMTWPAMFYGQRLAVERFIISPTTAQDRLDAHYILLLRSGIENCTLALEGTQFCDASATKELVEERSTRAVLGAMFMLNTDAVFNDLNLSRDELIKSIAAQDMWFSSKEYYQKYLQQIVDKREQSEQYLNENYYLPYKHASDLYLKAYKKAADLYAQATKPEQFEKIANEAASQVADTVEAGWEQYHQAVVTFNNFTANAEAASGTQKGLYNKFCNGHEKLCDSVLGKFGSTNMDNNVEQAKGQAEDQFYDRTGYPPDIASKYDFINNQKTQDEIRISVEQMIREHIDGYTLPLNWSYDPATFKNDLLNILQSEAQSKAIEIASKIQAKWREKTKIDPGLSREAFFTKLGGDPIPPLTDMVMSEEAFREKYIVPANKKIVDQTLEDMKKEGPSFANRQEKAEQGKEYIRVLYIPAIALCLSIIIVVVTIGRYLTNAATDLSKKIRWVRGFSSRQLKLIRPFYWIVFTAAMLGLPYLWPNTYISTAAYAKYYHLASTKAPVTTAVLDWVVHVQPIIYRAGAVMPDVAYIKK